MKQILNLLLSLILISCATTGVAETPVVIIDTKVSITPRVPSPSPTITVTAVPLTSTLTNTDVIPMNASPAPTVTPTPTIIFTPDIPCDPFRKDYCITYGHFLLQRPIQPPANDLIDPGYAYGSTANGTRDPHHGVEFSNPSGTPVYAAAEGTVVFAGPDDQALYAPWGNFYGNVVVIQHSHDLFTLYAHLSKIDARMNQKVLAGDKIGEVGKTGGAIGSHLHFEVRRGHVEDYFATQNPELWLIPAKDDSESPLGTLMISVVDSSRSLVKGANFTVGYYSDPSGSPHRMYYVSSYSPDLLTGQENAVLGELVPGDYRIVVEMNGQISERWVEVESGMLTQVMFVIK